MLRSSDTQRKPSKSRQRSSSNAPERSDSRATTSNDANTNVDSKGSWLTRVKIKPEPYKHKVDSAKGKLDSTKGKPETVKKTATSRTSVGKVEVKKSEVTKVERSSIKTIKTATVSKPSRPITGDKKIQTSRLASTSKRNFSRLTSRSVTKAVRRGSAEGKPTPEPSENFDSISSEEGKVGWSLQSLTGKHDCQTSSNYLLEDIPENSEEALPAEKPTPVHNTPSKRCVKSREKTDARSSSSYRSCSTTSGFKGSNSQDDVFGDTRRPYRTTYGPNKSREPSVEGSCKLTWKELYERTKAELKAKEKVAHKSLQKNENITNEITLERSPSFDSPTSSFEWDKIEESSVDDSNVVDTIKETPREAQANSKNEINVRKTSSTDNTSSAEKNHKENGYTSVNLQGNKSSIDIPCNHQTTCNSESVTYTAPINNIATEGLKTIPEIFKTESNLSSVRINSIEEVSNQLIKSSYDISHVLKSNNETSSETIKSCQEISSVGVKSIQEISNQVIKSNHEMTTHKRSKLCQDTSNRYTKTNQGTLNRGIKSNHDISGRGIKSNYEIPSKGIKSMHEITSRGIKSTQEITQQGITSNHEISNQGIKFSQEVSSQGVKSSHELSNQTVQSNPEASDLTVQSSHEEATEGTKSNKNIFNNSVKSHYEGVSNDGALTEEEVKSNYETLNQVNEILNSVISQSSQTINNDLHTQTDSKKEITSKMSITDTLYYSQLTLETLNSMKCSEAQFSFTPEVEISNSSSSKTLTEVPLFETKPGGINNAHNESKVLDVSNETASQENAENLLKENIPGIAHNKSLLDCTVFDAGSSITDTESASNTEEHCESKGPEHGTQVSNFYVNIDAERSELANNKRYDIDNDTDNEKWLENDPSFVHSCFYVDVKPESENKFNNIFIMDPHFLGINDNSNMSSLPLKIKRRKKRKGFLFPCDKAESETSASTSPNTSNGSSYKSAQSGSEITTPTGTPRNLSPIREHFRAAHPEKVEELTEDVSTSCIDSKSIERAIENYFIENIYSHDTAYTPTIEKLPFKIDPTIIQGHTVPEFLIKDENIIQNTTPVARDDQGKKNRTKVKKCSKSSNPPEKAKKQSHHQEESRDCIEKDFVTSENQKCGKKSLIPRLRGAASAAAKMRLIPSHSKEEKKETVPSTTEDEAHERHTKWLQADSSSAKKHSKEAFGKSRRAPLHWKPSLIAGQEKDKNEDKKLTKKKEEETESKGPTTSTAGGKRGVTESRYSNMARVSTAPHTSSPPVIRPIGVMRPGTSAVPDTLEIGTVSEENTSREVSEFSSLQRPPEIESSDVLDLT